MVSKTVVRKPHAAKAIGQVIISAIAIAPESVNAKAQINSRERDIRAMLQNKKKCNTTYATAMPSQTCIAPKTTATEDPTAKMQPSIMEKRKPGAN